MKRVLCSLALMTVILMLLAPQANAAALEGLDAALPADLEPQVLDVCADHQVFEQVSLREDGWFAVLSKYTNPSGNREDLFVLNYVDLYDEQGVFQKELCFRTAQTVKIELTRETLDVYFYDFVLRYRLDSHEIQADAITPGAIWNEERLRQLPQDEFSIGAWTYRCKKVSQGYTEFYRTNGRERQTLVSYEGTGFSASNNMLISALGGLAAAGLVVFLHKRRKGK